MITKGTVEKVLNKWYARVRIPIYDGKEDSEGATSDVNLSQATVCALPNTLTNLGKGDVVYVAFEDDDIGKPVIIGWLQKGTGNNSEVGLTLSTLTTKSTTFLDKQTYIGDIQPFEIQKLENVRDNIQGQIDLANSNIDDVKANVETISTDIETINNDLTPIKEALDGYDISKGTVEERLTKLGFKEGSITLASGFTATTNYLKRQGNYVILDLRLSLTQSQLTNLLLNKSLNIGIVPQDFRPSNTVISTTQFGTCHIRQTIGSSTRVASCSIAGITGLHPSGDIRLEGYSTGSPITNLSGIGLQNFSSTCNICLGYIALPVTT